MTLEEYRTGRKPWCSYISFGGKTPSHHIVRHLGFAVLTDEAKDIASREPDVSTDSSVDDWVKWLNNELNRIGCYPPKGFQGSGKGTDG